MEPYADVQTSYREFASYAAGESDTYEDWALRVADDAEVAAWIAGLPPIKQQPNLVFAAARWHGVAAPGPYSALREALLSDTGAIRATILDRATQTNEVGRLATLLPAFARFPEPLALLEVGASAGLNLYPDRWGYRWATPDGEVLLGGEPRLTATVTGEVPLPTTLPRVAWRGGIDLHPLDVMDADAMAWLENLVWPEHDERRARLRQAVQIARTDPPRLVTGDLLDHLPALVAEAGRHGTVVVFHSAVIVYLEAADRLRFDTLIRSLVADGACHWVSNEAPGVLPSVTGAAPVPHNRFVLGVDGHRVGITHGHGRSLHGEP